MDDSLNHEQPATPSSTVQRNAETSRPAPVRLSRSEIEKILKYVKLVSIFQDPVTGQFEYLRKERLESIEDYKTVDTLLHPRDADESAPYRPRYDLFMIDISSKRDHLSEDENDEKTAKELDSRRNTARTMLGALGLPFGEPFFQPVAKFDKTPPLWALEDGPRSWTRSVMFYHIVSLGFGVSWSYRPKTGQITGIVKFRAGRGEKEANGFISNLIRHRSVADSPMLLAFEAQCVLNYRLRSQLLDAQEEIEDTAERTGYHNFLIMGQAKRQEDFDPAAETARVSGIADELASNHNSWEGMEDMSAKILEEIEIHKACPQGFNEDSYETSNQYIRDRVISMASISKAMCRQSASTQQKATIQIQGLFNIIAQREQVLSRQIARDTLLQTEASLDQARASLQLGEATRQIAADSKRDSTSMKAIAAVTMFFLPGTFVASLFSMPIFRWNSDTGDQVVSHRIWAYWAVTIPLTLLTFGCFLLWDHLMNKPKYEHLRVMEKKPPSDQATTYSMTPTKTTRSRSVSRHSARSSRVSFDGWSKRSPTSVRSAPCIMYTGHDDEFAIGFTEGGHKSHATI